MSERLSEFQLEQAAESAIVTLACTGDSLAFSELVRRCQNRVRNFMRRLSNYPDQADDLSQLVFLKTWKSIHQLRSPGAFHGWLKRIMISVWLEEVRRAKADLVEWDETIPAVAPRAFPGAILDLDSALAQLSPSMRLCVVLAYNEGMSQQEISDATGFPLGTVKSNIWRGAEKMRMLLSDHAHARIGGGDAA